MPYPVAAVRGKIFGGQVVYLLRDEFITARAAGSVDGTAAEPGPGTRNVTDVGGNISISGGQILVAGATGALSQTVLWYTPTIGRRVGQAVAFSFTTPTNFIPLCFGGLSAVAGPGVSSDNTAYQINGTTLSARRTATANSPAIHTLVLSTTYRMYFVLRLVGRFMFLKSAGITKLLWFDEWDNTTPLYVDPFNDQIHAGTAVAFDDVVALDNRVYRVDALASDSFNRANGPLGSTDGMGHQEANSGSGKAWTAQAGTWAISGNTAICSALAGGIGIATVDVGTPDVVLAVDVTQTGGNVGFVLRYVDANNYIYGYYDGANVTLRKVVGGVDTQVLAPVAIAGGGTKFMVTADGTKFRLFFEELDRGAEQTISDAALQTGAAHGLYTSNTGNSFDDFVVFRRSGWNDLGAY